MATTDGPEYRLRDEIGAHYEVADEQARTRSGSARLELLRTQEILARYLPAPPARVIDVGRGAGAYAVPLAERGYDVHLIDAVELHVEQAKAYAGGAPLASAQLGDARSLDFSDAFADAALLFGPLYHLITGKTGLRR